MEDYSNDGKRWTWEETLIAFELYSRIPYSKISRTDKEIIKTAKMLRRKPGAVAKKLFNIEAHDPKMISIGLSGLSHSSKFDKEIWERFETDSSEISVESQKALAKVSGVSVETLINGKDGSIIVETFPYGEDKIAATYARIGQSFFRSAVLSAYRNKCCVTGITDTKLLIASHIKPWKDSDAKKERTNHRNGLCLNALHDKAFDQGLITLNDNYEIVLSNRIQKCEMDEETKAWFMMYQGKRIALPDKFLPDMDFIHYHNDEVFLH